MIKIRALRSEDLVTMNNGRNHVLGRKASRMHEKCIECGREMKVRFVVGCRNSMVYEQTNDDSHNFKVESGSRHPLSMQRYYLLPTYDFAFSGAVALLLT